MGLSYPMEKVETSLIRSWMDESGDDFRAVRLLVGKGMPSELPTCCLKPSMGYEVVDRDFPVSHRLRDNVQQPSDWSWSKQWADREGRQR